MAESSFNPYLNRRPENRPDYKVAKPWHTYDTSRFTSPNDPPYRDPATSNLVIHADENWQPIRFKK